MIQCYPWQVLSLHLLLSNTNYISLFPPHPHRQNISSIIEMAEWSKTIVLNSFNSLHNHIHTLQPSRVQCYHILKILQKMKSTRIWLIQDAFLFSVNTGTLKKSIWVNTLKNGCASWILPFRKKVLTEWCDVFRHNKLPEFYCPLTLNPPLPVKIPAANLSLAAQSRVAFVSTQEPLHRCKC